MASMQTRRLGRTEHQSAVAILGGAAFMAATPAEAEAPFHNALACGVNHLDIAPGYALAERAVGPHLQNVRAQVFVACKTGRKNPQGVEQQLQQSLQRLRCDYFDLYQLHGVTDLPDLESRSAAMEIIMQAKARGQVRFVGITGHDVGAPAAHLEALRRWDLDTVMFPVYPRAFADAKYRAAAEALLAECTKRDAAAMAIKACARRPWGAAEITHNTWYAPYTAAADISRGVRFALSTPGISGFCTPSDFQLLPLALDAARNFTPMDAAERKAAISATAEEELIFPLAQKARARPGRDESIRKRMAELTAAAGG